MYKHLFLVAGLLMSLAASAAETEQQKCDRRCTKEPTSALDSFVRVDASTKSTGRKTFAEARDVDFIIVKKNPFKYEYLVNIDVQPLEPAIVAGAFLEMGILPPPSGSAKANACDLPLFTPLKATKTQGLAKIKVAEDGLKAYADPAKAIADFLALTDKDEIDCAAVCKQLDAVSANIEELLKPAADVKAAYDDLKKLAVTAKTQIAAAKADATFMADQDCKTAVEQADLDVSKWPSLFDDRLAALEKAQAGAKHLKAIIAALNDSSFHEIRKGLVTGASQITFTLKRRDLRVDSPKDELMTELVVQAGTSRITVSAGIGFSTIKDVSIVSQKAPDPLNKGKTIDVFAEENGSSFRPNPVMMLNANIGKPFPFMNIDSATALFSWSLGVVVASRSDTTQTEYITGPSIGFLENNVVFTFGFHAARVASLGGGFKIGDVVPDDVKSAIPVTHKWSNGFMLGVTYRFK